MRESNLVQGTTRCGDGHGDHGQMIALGCVCVCERVCVGVGVGGI